MHYQIEFLPSALEQLRTLPKDARRLIGGKLDRAQHDLTGDIKKLKGFKNKYRLRAENGCVTGKQPKAINAFCWRVFLWRIISI